MMRTHQQKDADATLLVHQRTDSNSMIAMDESGRITDFIERPTEAMRKTHPYTWVNSGAYILDPAILDVVPEGVACDFPRDIFPNLINRMKIMGYKLTGYRCAIDSPARYDEACAAVREGRLSAVLPD